DSAASWSNSGAIILHGPHHGAQQSTRTGRPIVCSTSRSKLWSVIVIGFESCSPAEPASFSPHRPHFASLFASLLSSIRFFVPQWLQTTTCIQHLFQCFSLFIRVYPCSKRNVPSRSRRKT